ncbi:MAG: RNA-directed DNA polymerase [Fermentimonas sp.]|nr:RNA-directed DNA polymerase [Fermentimonas sp.]
MRKFTLLSIEDQIVYQAFINVIAEYHFKKVRHRYNKTVFGNLYAGKRNQWFYRKWIDSYNKYRRSLKRYYKAGSSYIASFDLTACYDSIDHQVIEYFLNQYGIQKEFCDRLISCLLRWSANNEMLHGHGIPQGPLASGLLSEVVLSHFEDRYEKSKKNNKDVFYFRYVDDIKLLGKDERSLRGVLAHLDYASKQIGLFPQSQKISIHKIEDIDKETKSISIPIEVLPGKGVDTKQVNKKIVKLTRNNNIDKPTEFKRYLANASHTAQLSLRLLDLLNYHPEMSENIALYFKNYPRKIFSKVVDKLVLECKEPEVFQIVNAQQIEAIKDRISETEVNKVLLFLQERWNKRNKKPLNPAYKVVCLSYLLENNKFTYKEIQEMLMTENDWWALKSIIKYIDMNTIGEPSYLELLNTLLRSASNDVALAAAQEVVNKGLKLSPPYNDINLLAQNTLKYSGVIYRRANSKSYIGDRLNKICDYKFPGFKWKKFFIDHDAAENKIIRAYGYSKSDMSAFVNILDVFNDLLLDNLFRLDGSIGKYTLGKIGGVLSERCRFRKKYPKLFSLCKEIHNKRLECDLSHAIVRNSKKNTTYIEYKYIFEARRLMISGYQELILTLKI